MALPRNGIGVDDLGRGSHPSECSNDAQCHQNLGRHIRVRTVYLYHMDSIEFDVSGEKADKRILPVCPANMRMPK